MRCSVLTTLLFVASFAAATDNAANFNLTESQRGHEKIRRRVLNGQQQVSLQVNLAENCQVETTQ
jgi:hypothetical protein